MSYESKTSPLGRWERERRLTNEAMAGFARVENWSTWAWAMQP